MKAILERMKQRWWPYWLLIDAIGFFGGLVGSVAYVYVVRNDIPIWKGFDGLWPNLSANVLVVWLAVRVIDALLKRADSQRWESSRQLVYYQAARMVGEFCMAFHDLRQQFAPDYSYSFGPFTVPVMPDLKQVAALPTVMWLHREQKLFSQAIERNPAGAERLLNVLHEDLRSIEKKAGLLLTALTRLPQEPELSTQLALLANWLSEALRFMLKEHPEESANYLMMNLYRVEDPIKRIAGIVATHATHVEHRPEDGTLLKAIIRGPQETQNSEARASS